VVVLLFVPVVVEWRPHQVGLSRATKKYIKQVKKTKKKQEEPESQPLKMSATACNADFLFV